MSENDALKRHRRTSKRVPLIIIGLIFGLAGVAILRERVAAVDEWVGKAFYPQRWQAAENCRRATLAPQAQFEFPRLLERGEVHPTAGGYLVNDIVVGYMGQSGAESYATFSCYLDEAGNVVRTARQRHNPCARPRPAFPGSAEGQ